MTKESRILTFLMSALITLHQPLGEVYINPDEIMIISPPTKGMGPKWAGSSVTVHDKTIFVIELPLEVKKIRDAAVQSTEVIIYENR